MSPPRRRREPEEGPSQRVRRGDGHVAYRLLDYRGDLDPWLSDYAAGRYPMDSRANALFAMGLSMWNTKEAAEDANTWLRIPYDRVAEVRLDGDRGIWWARTGPWGHYTVWGRPDELQESVLDDYPL
jgi:hypothetical protein